MTRGLSKRMIQVLELLQRNCHSYDKEKLKESLQKFQAGCAQLRAMLGKPVNHKDSIVTDEDVELEILHRNSMPLKHIILTCEGLVDQYKQFFLNNQTGNCLKHDSELYAGPYSYLNMRFHVSLVEVLAGKLFPKGRSWRHHSYSKHYDGYEEAFKKAKKLEASYSRTLITLMKLGLVAKFQHPKYNKKRCNYVITSHGQDALAYRQYQLSVSHSKGV